MTAPDHIRDTDEELFWLERVARLGSNSAADGFESLRGLILSGRLSSRELRSLAGAMRSLAGAATDAAAEMEDRVKRPWLYKKEAAQ